MTLNASKSDNFQVTENDVAVLFSHFGDRAQGTAYRELVREDAAVIAASRWPLLAEIEGIESTPGSAK